MMGDTAVVQRCLKRQHAAVPSVGYANLQQTSNAPPSDSKRQPYAKRQQATALCQAAASGSPMPSGSKRQPYAKRSKRQPYAKRSKRQPYAKATASGSPMPSDSKRQQSGSPMPSGSKAKQAAASRSAMRNGCGILVKKKI